MAHGKRNVAVQKFFPTPSFRLTQAVIFFPQFFFFVRGTHHVISQQKQPIFPQRSPNFAVQAELFNRHKVVKTFKRNGYIEVIAAKRMTKIITAYNGHIFVRIFFLQLFQHLGAQVNGIYHNVRLLFPNGLQFQSGSTPQVQQIEGIAGHQRGHLPVAFLASFYFL